jgi:group I intron endonuclease
MQGVYWWLNTVNGKAYIGSARNIARRKSAHLTALRADKHHSIHLQRAWNTYGPHAFKFEIIEKVEDSIWLEARETAWMLRLQSFKKDNGYNITRDGWTGAHYEPTEKRREAWRANGLRKQGTKDSPEVKARKKAAAIKRITEGKGVPSHLGHPHSSRDRTNLKKAWISRRERGDYYKFTAEDTIKGVATAALINKNRWQNPEERKSISEAQSRGWTPEVKARKSQQVKQWWASRKAQESVV